MGEVPPFDRGSDDQPGETGEEHLALSRRTLLRGLGAVAAGSALAALRARRLPHLGEAAAVDQCRGN